MRWWITHLHRKRVLKELGLSLRLMSVAAFVSILLYIFKKHNNDDDAYLNNKHRKKHFSIILTCFERQLGGKL